MSDSKSDKKEVVEKVVEPKAPVVAKEPERTDVCFYFLKTRKWRTLFNIKGNRLELKAENSILSIAKDDPLYDAKLDFMNSHKGNRAKGGTEFVELTSGDKKPGGKCLLDSLLEMSKESLLNVLIDRDPKNRALSRGAIMMLILKEKKEA